MIIFWIIGALFFLIGSLFGIPTLRKLLKCKERTTGKIVSIDHSSGKNARAVYEYLADNTSYTSRTTWTPHHNFHLGGECQVMYDKNAPKHSYIKQSGQVIRCVVGTLFALIGVGVLLLGVLFSSALQ